MMGRRRRFPLLLLPLLSEERGRFAEALEARDGTFLCVASREVGNVAISRILNLAGWRCCTGWLAADASCMHGLSPL